jgi:hypothetical protein
MKKLAVVLTVVGCFVCAAAALAASSPTVTPRPATGITTTGAVLNGAVNPNGSITTYHFDYGPTTALGTLTSPVKLGAGTSAVAVKAGIANLTGGTVYYYALVATNAYGTSVSTVKTFKSGGNPPPVPTTGAAAGDEPNQVTLTGTVTTDGQATTYYFQYGLEPTYGLQTTPVTIPAAATPVAVQATLTGLAPAATFHYRLVATHGSAVDTGVGADATIETLPFPVPLGTIHMQTVPRRIKSRPFTFTTNGLIVNPAAATTPDTLACNTAIVPIEFFVGHRVIATNQTTVGPTCQFTATTTLGRLPHIHGLRSNAPMKIRIKVEFLGSPWLAPSKRFGSVTVR